MREGSYPTANEADRSVLFPEQTRLETRLDDVEWTSDNGTAHPTKTDTSVSWGSRDYDTDPLTRQRRSVAMTLRGEISTRMKNCWPWLVMGSTSCYGG